LSEWVDQFEWQFWFTGTFQPERSYRDTIKTKRAYEKFISKLSKDFNMHNIEYFLAVERFKHGDFTHCHSLINGLDGLSYRQIGETWRSLYGREQVESYIKDKGANFYLTKYVTKELCDWDLRIDKRKSYYLNFEEK
jgi:hypothetical protein